MSKTSHPFLDPLWRRIVLIGAVFGWSAVEFYMGSETWGIMVGIFAVYGLWSYILNYMPSTQSGPQPPADQS